MANQVAYGIDLVPETLLGHRELVVPPAWEAMLEKNFPRFDPAKHNTRITIAPLFNPVEDSPSCISPERSERHRRLNAGCKGLQPAADPNP